MISPAPVIPIALAFGPKRMPVGRQLECENVSNFGSSAFSIFPALNDNHPMVVSTTMGWLLDPAYG